ncbi:MAG TPA: hypothetical protein VMZ30_05505 [Pyrinomonadaceae bacterium]|nr:hypothetical protein [Pyrinomonadaceae bacterium]
MSIEIGITVGFKSRAWGLTTKWHRRPTRTSHLNGVSKLLGKDVSPSILSTEEGVINFARSIEGLHATGTISYYKSALRQYGAAG